VYFLNAFNMTLHSATSPRPIAAFNKLVQCNISYCTAKWQIRGTSDAFRQRTSPLNVPENGDLYR
jgi:hypothetical protein